MNVITESRIGIVVRKQHNANCSGSKRREHKFIYNSVCINHFFFTLLKIALFLSKPPQFALALFFFSIQRRYKY
jgi:hypothetical protein